MMAVVYSGDYETLVMAYLVAHLYQFISVGLTSESLLHDERNGRMHGLSATEWSCGSIPAMFLGRRERPRVVGDDRVRKADEARRSERCMLMLF